MSVDGAGRKPTGAAARSDSPLTWLSRRKDKTGAALISVEQFRAGERLASDFHRAQMMPSTTMRWDGLSAGGRGAGGAPGFGVELRDGVVAARERTARALTAVGPDLARVLVDVCCHETGLELLERRSGWPERSGKVVVQYALNALARHYGYLPDHGQAWAGATGVRHWGTPDYRPRVDGE